MKNIDIIKQHIAKGHTEAPATVAFVAVLKRLHDREFVSPKQFYEIGGQFYQQAATFIDELASALLLTQTTAGALEHVNANLEAGLVDETKTGLIEFAEEVVAAMHNELNPDNKVATIGEIKPPFDPAKVPGYIAILERHEQEINNYLNE